MCASFQSWGSAKFLIAIHRHQAWQLIIFEAKGCFRHAKRIKDMFFKKVINPFSGGAFDDMCKNIGCHTVAPVTSRMKGKRQFCQSTHHIVKRPCPIVQQASRAVVRRNRTAKQEFIRKAGSMCQKMFHSDW